MTIEEKIQSVESSISNLQNSMITRLNNIREKQNTLFMYVFMLAVANSCAEDFKYRNVRTRLDNIIATQEQCSQVYIEADAQWYLIDGRKAYITIEGEPIEQYMKEKQHE